MKSVEVVQHLATAFREMNVPDSYYDEVNVGGTRIALEEAQRADASSYLLHHLRGAR